MRTSHFTSPRNSNITENLKFWWPCIVIYLIIKLIRCTNFSNLFLEQNTTYFGQFLCPSSGVFHCTHSNGICHTGLLTACEQDQEANPSWSCSQAVSKPVCYISLLCVLWKTPDDEQRNYLKHVESYSKNKFDKLVHLIDCIIRIPEIQWDVRMLMWQGRKYKSP